MLIGVIADDFTGASDIANTLAKGIGEEGGLRTTLYLGVPQENPGPDEEACVIALKSRSIPAADAVTQSLAALEWLQRNGCRQAVFKYCSTFDSTPQGNIGPVGEALAGAMGVSGVVACPAFPAAGRTVYQGHLFVHDRLLNESGLENHPINPMTDADIRRWLRRQSGAPVGLVPAGVVFHGAEAVAAALDVAAGGGETLVIVDAIRDEDLVTIGAACAGRPLVTGGSGIAMGLPRNFIRSGAAQGSTPQASAVPGPEAILAGSCSGKTLEQVERHAHLHPVRALDVHAIIENRLNPSDIVAFLRQNEGRAPLVFTSAKPAAVRQTQAQHGAARVSAAIDGFFATVAQRLVADGVRRLVVAGGETSGAVVSALGLGPLAIAREIDPGVPILISTGNPRMALALKSGNFGDVDFFDKALAMMETAG
ncbi:3-oxo-tetronate kinase [Pseudochelatococcus sp. B33]